MRQTNISSALRLKDTIDDFPEAGVRADVIGGVRAIVELQVKLELAVRCIANDAAHGLEQQAVQDRFLWLSLAGGQDGVEAVEVRLEALHASRQLEGHEVLDVVERLGVSATFVVGEDAVQSLTASEHLTARRMSVGDEPLRALELAVDDDADGLEQLAVERHEDAGVGKVGHDRVGAVDCCDPVVRRVVLPATDRGDLLHDDSLPLEEAGCSRPSRESDFVALLLVLGATRNWSTCTATRTATATVTATTPTTTTTRTWP